MTETMSHIALRKINGADKSDWFAHLNGVELSADERNCLQITAERLGINKLTTNDIVVINEDEEFKVLGRIDDVIISAGVKIHPLLIEQKLQKHIFSPLLLLGKKDEIAGEIVVLVIEGEFSIKAIYQLWQTLSAVLPANEIPRRLYFVDQIPLLPSGKPDRRGLKARV
jgi:O-succinylbenzoic acid--CoA ligase